MRVLMITGDKNIFVSGTPAHARFQLQQNAVGHLEAVYWGRGALRPALPEGPFDVVTVQDPFWRGLYAWRVARRLGAKLNVQVHTDLSAHSFLRSVLARAVLRRADSVRVVSEKIKKQVECAGVRVPVRVLPIYIDTEKFRAVVPQPHDKKTILWVGRFEEEKGPARAIAILKQVLVAGTEARLVMLGAGSLEKVLRRRAEKLPVEFPGWNDPVKYLAAADVVLCTSKHESYGASIVEALAAGVPVVAPDVGIAKEAGATVVPRERLAQACVEALCSPQRGMLKLPILSQEAWAVAWKESL